MGNKKGEFTVKSAYYVALSLVETEECGECSNGDQRTPLWRKIWHLKIPAKIRIFAWRACMNGLPTRLNLYQRGVNINPLCPMCEQEPESISHTLLHCNFAKQVWDKWEGCPINMKVRQGDFTDFALQMLNTRATQDLEILLVTSWSIWYNRNQKVFEDGSLSPDQVWFFTATTRFDYREAAALCNQKQTSDVGKWEAPPSGMCEVNVDGAVSGDGKLSSVGVIIRNNEGAPIAALCKLLPGQYSSLETEIIALENGIILAEEMGLTQVIFESDALTVVQDLQVKEVNGSSGNLYQGIIDLLESFCSWKFCHLKREYNKAAHVLAQFAKCNGTNQVWKGCVPWMIQHIIESERS